MVMQLITASTMSIITTLFQIKPILANMSFPPLCHQQPVAPDQADIARSSSAQAGGSDARLASLRARSAWSAACAASSAAAAASSNTAMAYNYASVSSARLLSWWKRRSFFQTSRLASKPAFLPSCHVLTRVFAASTLTRLS
jgi:hypothetical protein